MSDAVHRYHRSGLAVGGIILHTQRQIFLHHFERRLETLHLVIALDFAVLYHLVYHTERNPVIPGTQESALC